MGTLNPKHEEWSNNFEQMLSKIKSQPTTSEESWKSIAKSRFDSTSGYVPKLEIPKFDGINPRLWIRQCCKYFRVYKIPEDQKIEVASSYMVGKTKEWISSYMSVMKGADWTDIILCLVSKYRDEIGLDVQDKLFKKWEDSFENHIVECFLEDEVVVKDDGVERGSDLVVESGNGAILEDEVVVKDDGVKMSSDLIVESVILEDKIGVEDDIVDREKKAVAPIKDQDQELGDGDKEFNQECNGGLKNYGFELIVKTGGIVLDSELSVQNDVLIEALSAEFGLSGFVLSVMEFLHLFVCLKEGKKYFVTKCSESRLNRWLQTMLTCSKSDPGRPDNVNSWKGCKILFTSPEKFHSINNKCKEPVEITTLKDKEVLDMLKNTLVPDQNESPAVVGTLMSALLLFEGGSGGYFKLHDIIRDVPIAVKVHAFIFEKSDWRSTGNSADHGTVKVMHLKLETDDFNLHPDLVCPDLHSLWLLPANRTEQEFEDFRNLLERAQVVILDNTNVSISKIWVSNRKAFEDLRMVYIGGSDTIDYLVRMSMYEIQSKEYDAPECDMDYQVLV